MAEKKDEFERLGATVVALTPELPEYTEETAEKNDFPFYVLTDLNLEVADKYGLVFDLTHLSDIYEGFAKLSEKNGKESATKLPLSATYVIEKSGEINYAFVDADYRRRAEPSRIIDALESLAGNTRPEHLVLQFWENTWNPPYDLDLIDRLMTEDFSITSAGDEIEGRDEFKKWVAEFQKKAPDLRLDEQETFSNKEGDRVVSRWIARAKNGGLLGLPADDKPIEFSGIAIWEIRDGKLAHNWVERSAGNFIKG